MRLFVAIDFNVLKKNLSSVKIDDSLAKLNKVGNFHLTLKFLGDIDDVEPIKEKLRLIEFEPFKLTLDKIGFFPSENFVRVVWVGVKPVDKVKELQIKIEEALKEFKKDFEFYPHITLARVKFVRDKENFTKILKDIKIEEESIEVKDFRLVQSVLSPDGPVYEDVEVFELKG